jgi:hypothetical protein
MKEEGVPTYALRVSIADRLQKKKQKFATLLRNQAEFLQVYTLRGTIGEDALSTNAYTGDETRNGDS